LISIVELGQEPGILGAQAADLAGYGPHQGAGDGPGHMAVNGRAVQDLLQAIQDVARCTV